MGDSPKPEGLSEAGVGEPADHRLGHRDRVRQRFLKLGAESFADYELLEAVLHIVVPQRDTKDLAKSLLARFGSFSGVLAAPYEQLRHFKGLGDIRMLSIHADGGIEGVITGRALYDGRLDLAAAIQMAERA